MENYRRLYFFFDLGFFNHYHLPPHSTEKNNEYHNISLAHNTFMLYVCMFVAVLFAAVWLRH